MRQDNADSRLTPIGHEIGLISGERYEKYLEKEKMIEDEIKRLSKINLTPDEKLNTFLAEKSSSPVKSGLNACDFIKRPELSYEDLGRIIDMPELPSAVAEQVEIRIKYDGYIKRQQAQIEQMQRLEKKLMPEDIKYSEISGLRLEARQKLDKIRPASLGQASRISGVSPSDIAVLLIYLQQRGLK